MSHGIRIAGAREHNLKNVTVDIPKNTLTVVTGPSGSGKSSLAFDTLYAEGQRRYVESLSAYARQFLGVQKKPDVDDIDGLSPAISIEQKGVSHNPRSTVGTVTEIYDHLRLIFARIGVPRCPDCGAELHRHSVDEMVDMVLREHGGSRVEVMAPVVRRKKGAFRNLFVGLRKKGFLRVRVDGEVYWLEEDLELDKKKPHDVEVVVDRLKVMEDRQGRLAEAIQVCLDLSEGFVLLEFEGIESRRLTERYVCPDCGSPFPDLEPRLFSFNSPSGACPECSGIGSHRSFSEDLAVLPDRPLLDGALLPWRKNHYMTRRLETLLLSEKIDGTRPYGRLSKKLREMVLYGSDRRLRLTYERGGEVSEYMGRYEGLLPWLERRWRESDSEIVRDELGQYQAEDICQRCSGLRLRPESLSVFVGVWTLGDLVSMPVDRLLETVRALELDDRERQVVGQVIMELIKRLDFLVQVGAGYLSLNRRADTLSGGESQRIRLATQIGSKLTGVLYVLDEPTIGLHPRDTDRLIGTLSAIRDLGNTVVVVEHDRDVMNAADYLVEMGPDAGEGGGYVVRQGTRSEFDGSAGQTGPYLSGNVSGLYTDGRTIPGADEIRILGAEENNLADLDVSIPTGCLVCLTGVSGSGKSTLLYDVLYRGIRRRMDPTYRIRPGVHRDILGWESIKKMVMVDQSPIGRTPRSNPATYTGLFTHIREFFAQLPEAKIRGFRPGRFSFNVRGGRCEACGGAGVQKVSMLFMPDVYVDCDVCGGKRYNRETLEVTHRGRNIADVLEMTVDEAANHFSEIPAIASRLAFIQDAGLGYIRLGQSALTLSGGEAQRVKLAKELGRRTGQGTLYLLDEPTTGLFYTDVLKLIRILRRLVQQGNSVVVIEHNLDVICSGDYVIDLGPEGGLGGGRLVDAGSPEDLAYRKSGYTGVHIHRYMNERRSGP
ncbi:MAG: excinuclease ABC subunit A [Dethiosulfovibrio peptidovorans]|nr:MAG: excinuclease ABC subunit A [Dethiosulfovibrio peptidovorans]